MINKSKTYLLPLLSEFVNISVPFINRIENVYIQDNEGRYKNCIYILHNFNHEDEDYMAYEHELVTNELFVESHDIGDQILYIFTIPLEYLHEYEQYITSNYSKFGGDAKEIIIDFWQTLYKKSPSALIMLEKVKSILFKETKLKREIEDRLSSKDHKVVISNDAELGQVIDLENETFDFNSIQVKLDENNNREMW